MGGNIAVSSTFGNGSTFTVSLDLPVAEAEIALPAPFRADLPNLSVLIAEDDRVSREILISQLNRLGCDVTPTEDGHTALKELRKREFDVVFLDYNMPGKTGPEVAEAFRAIEAFGQHVPIIALTARGFEDDRRTCEEAGMDRMLTKPLSHRDLEQVLQEFVAKPRGAMPQPA